MWQQFLVDVAAQVGGSDLGDPSIHEPGKCSDFLDTRRTLQQLKIEYVDADDSEDHFLVHFEHAPQVVSSEKTTTKADGEIDRKVEERRSESDSSDILLPVVKKAASKSRKAKRASRSRTRDIDQEQGDADEAVREMSGKGEGPPKADENAGEEKIDEPPEDQDEAFGADEDLVEEEALENAGKANLTRSNDDHPLIRIGIWLNHDNARPTLEGAIPMDIVMVAEIKSKDEINYYGVPSWFVNGISIGDIERVEQEENVVLMAKWYTEDPAFVGQNSSEKIRQRLFQLLNDADTQEISLDDYNNIEDEEQDENILIQPPRIPELMDGNFPPASKAKGKKKQNDEDVAMVVYFVNNIDGEDLPLELNRQLDLEPEEDYSNFEEWLLDGHGDFEGIRKGLYNEVDKGGWNLYIEYEVFVLPQRPKKEGRMWNWKNQPNLTVGSFLNASMEEEYGRKLYIEVHLNAHPDTEKMNKERDKRFERDPKFRRRVSQFSEQPEGSSGRKGTATKTSSSKLKTKKTQEDLPAKKGVARKKASASGKGSGTKTKATVEKTQADEDESEHSDEL